MQTDTKSAPDAPMSGHVARSLLFVPGNRPDRFEKAAASAADVVICDLEDAVPSGDKAMARQHVARWLRSAGAAWVRLNVLDGPDFAADREELLGARGLLGIVVPKATDPDRLAAAASSFPPGLQMIALVETAAGIQQAYDIAAVQAVVRLAFGSIDFALDIDAVEDDDALLYARSRLVIASRAARIAAPIDGVTTALYDDTLVDTEARHARHLGFSGKLCIHPKQVDAVNRAFTPTDEEVRWARSITGGGADAGLRQVEGRMVDAPVAARAHRILQRVSALGLELARREP